MKILKGRNGNYSTLLNCGINPMSVFTENGNVIISTGWRGRRLSYKVVIPAILLRRLRDMCNKALTEIDGFERHTTVTLAGHSYKEGTQ